MRKNKIVTISGLIICLILLIILVRCMSNDKNNFRVQIGQDGYIITAYHGSKTDLTIPSKLNGIKVTEIGYYAFKDNNDIKSITVENGIETIKSNAFSEMANLENIKLPASIEEISINAFRMSPKLTSISVDPNNEYYSSEDGVLFNKTKTILISYLEGKDDASYTIPDSVSVIESDAFSNSKFSTIHLSNQLIEIKDNAFSYNSNLKTISLPESLTNISALSFRNCSNLEEINVDLNNENYSSIDGVLFNKDKTTLIKYPNSKILDKYIVPDGVTKIGNNSIKDTKLKEIHLSDSVVTIGEYAISNNLELQVISMQNSSVTDIEEYGFNYNPKLENILMSDSLINIGRYAFYGCSSITIINIPKNVVNVSGDSFKYMNNLISIEVDENNENYSSIEGVLFDKNQAILLWYPEGKTNTSYSVPNGVERIENNAFPNSTLEEIDLPESIGSIGNFAFSWSIRVVNIHSSTPPSIENEYASIFHSSDIEIIVPASSINLYKQAVGWSKYAEYITSE